MTQVRDLATTHMAPDRGHLEENALPGTFPQMPSVSGRVCRREKPLIACCCHQEKEKEEQQKHDMNKAGASDARVIILETQEHNPGVVGTLVPLYHPDRWVSF